jgi:hypothetical protein
MKKLLAILIPLIGLYAPSTTFYSDWGWGYYYWLFGPIGPSQSEGMAAAGYSTLEYRGYNQFSLGGWPGSGTQINNLTLRLRNNTGGSGLQITINRATSATPGWDECGGTSPVYLTNQAVNPNAEDYTYFTLTGTQAVTDLLAAWQSGASWFGFGYRGSRGSGEPCMHFFYAFWADYMYDAALIVDYTIGVEEQATAEELSGFSLQCYPNPFNRSVAIKFEIRNPKSDISLRIFDAKGRSVKSFRQLLFTQLHNYTVIWDRSDDSGLQVPPGVYFVCLESGSIKERRKIILVK